MIIDIFTYSMATNNGHFGIDSLVKAARDAKLDGICVTDRRMSSHARDLVAYGARENFFVGMGLELETSAGRVVVFPRDIDDAFVNEEWRCLGEVPEAADVLNYFHERNAIVVARDVYNRGEGLRDRIYCVKDANGRGFDGVDTIAAYRRKIDNELAISAQQGLKVPACAGSGVFDDLSDIGYCATLFTDVIHDQAEFVDAMTRNAHWACSLRDLGDASPMGSAPRKDDESSERHGDREDRGGRRFGRDRGERRFGDREHHGDDRRREGRGSRDHEGRGPRDHEGRGGRRSDHRDSRGGDRRPRR